MPNKTEKRREFIINVAFYTIIVILSYLCIKYVAKWIMPFIVGFFIALIFKPVISALHKTTKINRKLCAVLVLLLGYALIILLLWVIGSGVFTSLSNLFTQLPSYYNENIYPSFMSIYEFIVDLSARISPDTMDQLYSMFESFTDKLRDFVIQFSSSMVSRLAGATAGLPFFVISFVFTILSSIFISMDYPNITRFITRQLPPKISVFIHDARLHIWKTMAGYLKAYIIILLITFTELAIGLSILRIENAVGIAVIVALADILPVIGTGGILIPWAIAMLINQNFFVGLGLLVLYGIIFLVRNFTEPKIVGDQLGLHPLVTLIAIYVGYIWMGVAGMILLPVTVTIIVGLQKNGKIKLWK